MMNLVLECISTLLPFAMSKPLCIHQNLVCLAFSELQVASSPISVLELFVLPIVWFMLLYSFPCAERQAAKGLRTLTLDPDYLHIWIHTF